MHARDENRPTLQSKIAECGLVKLNEYEWDFQHRTNFSRTRIHQRTQENTQRTYIRYRLSTTNRDIQLFKRKRCNNLCSSLISMNISMYTVFHSVNSYTCKSSATYYPSHKIYNKICFFSIHIANSLKQWVYLYNAIIAQIILTLLMLGC